MQDKAATNRARKAAIHGRFGHACAAMMWCSIDHAAICSGAITVMPTTAVEFGVFVD
jgi:hypothetical protein